mmetsp:Transcript_1645/g.4581  ORF Transcript_1645/g.4581 Transcript_1645/m.4581 type:complete len:284 (+) Transcript_1645:3971-4822(+)
MARGLARLAVGRPVQEDRHLLVVHEDEDDHPADPICQGDVQGAEKVRGAGVHALAGVRVRATPRLSQERPGRVDPQIAHHGERGVEEVLEKPLQAGDAGRVAAQRRAALPSHIEDEQHLQERPNCRVQHGDILEVVDAQPFRRPQRAVVLRRDVVAPATAEVDVARDGEAVQLDHDGDAVAQKEVDDHEDARGLLIRLRDDLAALDAALVDVVEIQSELPLSARHLLPSIWVGVEAHLHQPIMKAIQVDGEGHWADVLEPPRLLENVEQEERQPLRALQELLA